MPCASARVPLCRRSQRRDSSRFLTKNVRPALVELNGILAVDLALLSAGNSSAARIPMIAMTTKTSISANKANSPLRGKLWFSVY